MRTENILERHLKATHIQINTKVRIGREEGEVEGEGGRGRQDFVPDISCFLVNSNRTIPVLVVVDCCQLIVQFVA